MATFDKVRDIVVEQLGVEADDVTIESTFIDDLGADSLDIVHFAGKRDGNFPKGHGLGLYKNRVYAESDTDSFHSAQGIGFL